jgi:hypothetical protein
MRLSFFSKHFCRCEIKINKIGNVRIAFAQSLRLLGYPGSLIPFQSRGTLLWLSNIAGKSETYLSPHVKCPTFLSYFNQIWIFSPTDFHKGPPPNIKFRGNPPSEGGADAYEQTDGTKRKLVDDFSNFRESSV